MLVEGTPVICAQPSTNSLSAAYTLQSLGSHPGMHPGAVQAVAYEPRAQVHHEYDHAQPPPPPPQMVAQPYEMHHHHHAPAPPPPQHVGMMPTYQYMPAEGMHHPQGMMMPPPPPPMQYVPAPQHQTHAAAQPYHHEQQQHHMVPATYINVELMHPRPDGRIDGAPLKTAPWTAAEDHIISEAVARFGCKWHVICTLVPGRTVASVRNRWHRLAKARRSEPVVPTNGSYRCGRCGQPKRGHVCRAAVGIDPHRLAVAREMMERLSHVTEQQQAALS